MKIYFWIGILGLMLAGMVGVYAATSATKPATGSAAAQPGVGFPELGTPRLLKPGVNFYQLQITKGWNMQMYLYLPAKPAAEKLPCVVIAPAGTRLFHGMGLSAEDQTEHLPYVEAGFAVLAYSLDGPLSERATDAQTRTALVQFRKAEAGIKDAKVALDFLEAKVPQVDRKRIYTVGHSSAGTVALQVAEHDARIAGCVAFAPICDLAARLAPGVRMLDALDAGSAAYLISLSPDKNVGALKCPVMLFSAEDDSNVAHGQVQDFAAAAGKVNKNIKMVSVKSGGHYEAMISQGIPMAVKYLKELASK